MFKIITLCLLVSSSFSLPHMRTADEERGLFIDILGGLVAGDATTTVAPGGETTTFATLYGDLVVSRGNGDVAKCIWGTGIHL